MPGVLIRLRAPGIRAALEELCLLQRRVSVTSRSAKSRQVVICLVRVISGLHPAAAAAAALLEGVLEGVVEELEDGWLFTVLTV